MTGYYYLIASLPVLAIENDALKSDPDELFNYIRTNLNAGDISVLNQILYQNDIKNLIRIIAETHQNPSPHPEFETFSSVPEEVINEYHYRLNELPIFMQKVIEESDIKFGEMSLLEIENRFLEAYYEFTSQSENSFIRSFFEFDQKLKNVLTAINCKKSGIDIEKMLLENEDSRHQLIRSSAKDFGLSGQLTYISRLIELSESASILELNHFIDQLRWQYATELTSISFFSLDNVLAYSIQLEIVKRIKSTDKETGKGRLDNLIHQAISQLEIPV